MASMIDELDRIWKETVVALYYIIICQKELSNITKSVKDKAKNQIEHIRILVRSVTDKLVPSSGMWPHTVWQIKSAY
jgi:23S rRNA A2030 N6-methylase RlmJ